MFSTFFPGLAAFPSALRASDSSLWASPMASDGRPKGIGGFRNTLTLTYCAKAGLLDQGSHSTEDKMARPEPHPIQTKNCLTCGKELRRREYPGGRSDSPSMHMRRLYCNRACQGIGLRSKQPSRSARHRRAAEFRKSKCERCDSTVRLSVHHVDRNPLNNDPANLMTLCSSCHTRWHWEHGHLDRAKASQFGSRRGSLNSRWVATLMNYPPNWCDAPDDKTGKP